MKKNLPKWVREKGDILQEISQDISWYGGKIKGKAKKSLKGMEPGRFHPGTLLNKETERKEGPEDFFPVPDPWEEAESLCRELDWAIHRAYYKEGGFRYFGDNLTRYVNVVLPSETSLDNMWAAGYNSCIQPMCRQLEKLEKELEALQAYSDPNLPDLEKKELLEKMRAFRDMAYAQRLHTDADWEAEAYRLALRSYAEELNRQLLEPYRLKEDD